MNVLSRPGATLLVVGFLLFVLVRPLIDNVWVIGGLLSGISAVVGLLGIVGGGYLLVRGAIGSAR